MKARGWALLLCLLLALPGWGASRTFGTGGATANLLASLDAASAGDSLIQVGSSVQDMTGAKSYSLANITVVGNGDSLWVKPTNAAHDLTFTGDGLKFVDCTNLAFFPLLNGANTTFEGCTLKNLPGATTPHPTNGAQALVYCASSTAMTLTATDCSFPYTSASPTVVFAFAFESNQEYTATFTRCDFKNGVYGYQVASASDFTFTDCDLTATSGSSSQRPMNWSNTTLDNLTIDGGQISGKSYSVANVAHLTVRDANIETASTSFSTGGTYSAIYASGVRRFTIARDTISIAATSDAAASGVSYVGINILPWTSLSKVCRIDSCYVPQVSGHWLTNYQPIKVKAGTSTVLWNSVAIRNNVVRSGMIYFWTSATTDNQAHNCTISGNSFATTARNPLGLVGGFKNSTITGNTFSGDLGIALALVGSRTGTTDTLSGGNTVTLNTFSQASDTSHLVSALITSDRNLFYNNTGTLTGTGDHQVVGVVSCMPDNLIYNNDFTFTGGRAFVSAINAGDSLAVYNNRISGATEYVVADDSLAFYEDGYMDYASIYQILNRWGNAYAYADAFTIGYSILGVPIVGLKVSDTAGTYQTEPGLCFTGGAHGDEHPACNIVVAYADSLLRAYQGTVTRAVNLVNQNELFFVPVWNPDGYMTHSRLSIEGFDQTRIWPDGYTSATNTKPAYQEAGALWQFFTDRNMRVHADIHNALDKVLYPWAANVANTTDNTSINALADAYIAAAYRTTTKNRLRTEFGANTPNTFYDWVYRYGGGTVGANVYCLSNTIEFGPSKRPAATTLPATYNGMWNAMTAYLEAATDAMIGSDSTACNTTPTALVQTVVKEGSNLSTATQTGFVSGTTVHESDFTDATSWRTTYGGRAGLSGLTYSAQGFVNVGINTGSVGQPAIARQQTGFRTPKESLESIRSIGGLKGVELDAYIVNPQDRANLKIWQYAPHPAGGYLQTTASDTLRVRSAIR